MSQGNNDKEPQLNNCQTDSLTSLNESQIMPSSPQLRPQKAPLVQFEEISLPSYQMGNPFVNYEEDYAQEIEFQQILRMFSNSLCKKKFL